MTTFDGLCLATDVRERRPRMPPAAADVVQVLRRGRVVQIGTAPRGAARDSNPRRDLRRVPDNRSTSARNEQVPQDSNPDPRGWSSQWFRYTRELERTTRIERVFPSWKPGALLIELHPHSTPGWTRTTVRCLRKTTLFRLSYGRKRSLRQESNPHFGRTKGACLPLTLRRLGWRRRDSNPLPRVASAVLFRLSYIPKVRTGGIEPPQPGATGLQPGELAIAQRPRD
jgi:hypothetical protein